jgi:catechol 2,3-dioxygenase-like lactoylglutathione lyase family enzyme
MLTLGVDDLERSLAFYRDGLGWTTPGIIGHEFPYGTVAFFDLQAGLKLALFPRENLAHDAGIEPTPPSATEFTLAQNVRSPQEVDAAMERARLAGATIIKTAQKTFYGGYAGYFADPDGHLWEVAFNPSLLPE